MQIDDCEIGTNEMNHQDMNNAKEDVHKKHLKKFIRESNKSS